MLIEDVYYMQNILIN